MRRPSHTLLVSLLLVLFFCLAGYGSSYVSRSAAELDARGEVERRVASFQAFVRQRAGADSPYRKLLGPLNWYAAIRSQDPSDELPWYVFADRYDPSPPDGTEIRLPWAFVKSRVGVVPFVVRVQQGYETTGMGGAQAVVTYLTFFGQAWRVHRLLLYVS